MEESTKLTTTEPVPQRGDLIAFARSADEMQQGQTQSIAWALNKLTEARQHLDHMSANLNQAKEYGWALRGFQEATRVARKQVEFYEKLHAAFNAGYCVVPDFPIDVFAVRTGRGALQNWKKRRVSNLSYKMKSLEGTNGDLDKKILEAVEANHIWLNALQCFRPTEEFCAQVGRRVIEMAMERSNCLPSRYAGDADEPVSEMGNLTPTLYLRVNAS